MSASTQQLAWTFAPSPNQNWTRRAYHGGVVVGDYLYIDGGEVAIGNTPWSLSIKGPNYTPLPVNCTLVLNLANGWNDPTGVSLGAISKPDGPIFDFSTLWYDETTNKSIYAFGGEQSKLDNHQLDLSVWRLDLDGKGGGTWSQNATAQSAPFSHGITRPSGGVGTFSQNAGFYIGGYENSRTSPQTQNLGANVPTPGVVTYNFTTRAWSNSSQGTNNISPTGSFEFGAVHPIPFGPNGLLAMFGGETSNSSAYGPGDERMMDMITLLDPVTGQWYQQNTSGSAAPLGRSKFCSVGIGDATALSGSNPPTGTYEIFMYGGYDGSLGVEAQQFDELWALTIPAFTWQQLDSGHRSARIGHSCHVVGQRQMLSIGGIDATQEDPWSTPDLTNWNGLGVYDMAAGSWTSGYNASAAPYSRCSQISSYYSKSGAYPANWNNPALKALFAQTPPPPENTTTPSNIPSTITASTSGSNHLGMIIGVVVAVVVAALMGLALCFCLLRRAHGRRRNLRNMPISSPIGQPEIISELSNTTRHQMSTAMSHHTLERKIMEEITRWNAPPPPRYCIEMDGGELDGGEVAREMNIPGRDSHQMDHKTFRTETRPVEADSNIDYGPPPARPPKMKVKTYNSQPLPPHPTHPMHPSNQPRKQPSRKRSSPILSPLDEERSEAGEKRSLRSDISPVEGRKAQSRGQKSPSPQLISPVD